MTESIDTTESLDSTPAERSAVTHEEHERRLAWLARVADLRRRILESRGGVPVPVEEIDEALGITCGDGE